MALNRRSFVSKLVGTGLITSTGITGFLSLNRDEIPSPSFKLFRLDFPDHLSEEESYNLIRSFWKLEEMNEIEKKFLNSEHIVYTKHRKKPRYFESLIGFSSELAYLQWEKSVAQTNCCDDKALKREGFTFNMSSFSIDANSLT